VHHFTLRRASLKEYRTLHLLWLCISTDSSFPSRSPDLERWKIRIHEGGFFRTWDMGHRTYIPCHVEEISNLRPLLSSLVDLGFLSVLERESSRGPPSRIYFPGRKDIHFRSPLLAESRLMYLVVTKMFQFTTRVFTANMKEPQPPLEMTMTLFTFA
jgi:hypothetical protein